MATLSCIIVLVLGNLLGSIVRGITGFGSAILNLCVWVVCTCLGLDAGTLQQAVVAECVCSEVCALPLLRLTRAASTCDWRLTASLFIFGAVGAPVGAALLTALPVRGVEFVMACVLLLVIGAHCHVLQHLRQWLHSSRQGAEHNKKCLDVHMACQEVSPAATALQDNSHTQEQLVSVLQVLSGPQEVAVAADAAATAAADGSSTTGQELQLVTGHPCLPGSSAEAPAVTTLPAVPLPAPAAELHKQQPQSAGPGHSQPGSISTDGRGQGADGPKLAGTSSVGSSSCHSSDDENALLLSDCQAARTSNSGSGGSSSSSSNSDLSFISTAVAHGSSWQGCWRAVQQWWARENEPERRRATLRLVMYGSLAGSVSGAMAGMTGMGGPPLMLLYEKLHIKKDTVRGCNAVLSVLQFRVIAYALTGIFTREDLLLYVAVSVAGLSGLCLGSHLAARMDQATFSRVLVGLMLLCCALLFASSAGLTGR